VTLVADRIHSNNSGQRSFGKLLNLNDNETIPTSATNAVTTITATKDLLFVSNTNLHFSFIFFPLVSQHMLTVEQ
jgi:hypothetical protein